MTPASEQDYGRTTEIIASGAAEPAFVPDASAAAAWRSGPFSSVRPMTSSRF